MQLPELTMAGDALRLPPKLICPCALNVAMRFPVGKKLVVLNVTFHQVQHLGIFDTMFLRTQGTEAVEMTRKIMEEEGIPCEHCLHCILFYFGLFFLQVYLEESILSALSTLFDEEDSRIANSRILAAGLHATEQFLTLPRRNRRYKLY